MILIIIWKSIYYCRNIWIGSSIWTKSKVAISINIIFGGKIKVQLIVFQEISNSLIYTYYYLYKETITNYCQIV